MKRIFRAKTETDAIVLALQEMAFMDEVVRTLHTTSGRIPGYKPVR